MIEEATLLEGTNSVATRSWLKFGKRTEVRCEAALWYSRGQTMGQILAMSRFSLRKTGDKIRDLGEELRDGFSPGFDTVNEWAAQLNQVRLDIEQIRKDVAEIKKAPGVVRQ
jgi:hypothetical protein